MSVKCQTIMEIIERLAPKDLAEEWDNVGLQIGDPRAEINKILVSLDLTKDVVDEAIEQKADMIITHHPFIFNPLKNIRWDLESGGLIKKLIQHDIHLYSAHTNLDKAENGLNDMLAERLLLRDIEILMPSNRESLLKIVVYVHKDYAENIRHAFASQGAGWIGNYSHCTFSVQGTGTFKPLEGATPFLGNIGEVEYADECRIESIISSRNLSPAIKAVIKAHPYEEVVYDVYPLENQGKEFGLGRIGTLTEPLSAENFLRKIKSDLHVEHLKVAGERKAFIKKVALCSGSGAELIHRAAILGADAYITGDMKYHEAQQAKTLGIFAVDAGHFATEVIVMNGIKAYLDTELTKFKREIEVITSKVNRDFFEWE